MPKPHHLLVKSSSMNNPGCRLYPSSPCSHLDTTKPVDKEVNIPALSGIALESYNYMVCLGTPKQPVPLAFDTGSNLTWTQCKPCLVLFYEQQNPIFKHSASRSFSNVSCSSPQCSQLSSGHRKIFFNCSISRKCVYGVVYGSN